jgi:hypothetical protein
MNYKFFCAFAYPPAHLSVYITIHLPFHLSIYPSIHSSTNPSIFPSFQQLFISSFSVLIAEEKKTYLCSQEPLVSREDETYTWIVFLCISSVTLQTWVLRTCETLPVTPPPAPVLLTLSAH